MTNTAVPGKYVVVTGRAVVQEVRATRVAGNVFEFTAVEAGQPF